MFTPKVLEREAEKTHVSSRDLKGTRQSFVPLRVHGQNQCKNANCGSSSRSKPLPAAAMDALFTYGINFAQPF
jgi:hypothetical protein